MVTRLELLNKNSTTPVRVSPRAIVARSSLRGHADRAVETDRFTVEHRVLHDRLD